MGRRKRCKVHTAILYREHECPWCARAAQEQERKAASEAAVLAQRAELEAEVKASVGEALQKSLAPLADRVTCDVVKLVQEQMAIALTHAVRAQGKTLLGQHAPNNVRHGHHHGQPVGINTGFVCNIHTDPVCGEIHQEIRRHPFSSENLRNAVVELAQAIVASTVIPAFEVGESLVQEIDTRECDRICDRLGDDHS